MLADWRAKQRNLADSLTSSSSTYVVRRQPSQKWQEMARQVPSTATMHMCNQSLHAQESRPASVCCSLPWPLHSHPHSHARKRTRIRQTSDSSKCSSLCTAGSCQKVQVIPRSSMYQEVNSCNHGCCKSYQSMRHYAKRRDLCTQRRFLTNCTMFPCTHSNNNHCAPMDGLDIARSRARARRAALCWLPSS